MDSANPGGVDAGTVPGPVSGYELGRFLQRQESAHLAYLRGKLRSNRFLVAPEDVLQEARGAAVNGLAKFVASEPNSLDKWFQTVLQRKLWDTLEHAGAVKRGGEAIHVRAAGNGSSSFQDLFHRIRGDQRTASSVVGAREAERTVRNAMDNIPIHYRQAVALYFLEEKSYASVAARMMITKTAARARITRGLQMLKEQLA